MQAIMMGDSGDSTQMHLQRHGSTASDCTTTRSYASSNYSSGYSSTVSGGSVGLYHPPNLTTTMSGAATGASTGPGSAQPLFEEEPPELREPADEGIIADSSSPPKERNFAPSEPDDAVANNTGAGSGKADSRTTSTQSSEKTTATEKSSARNHGKEAKTPIAEGSSSTKDSSATSTPEAAPPSPSPHSGGEQRVKRIGRYTLSMQTLGKGNFARVELARHTQTQAKVAIKIIQTDKIKEDYVKRNLLRESAIMRQLEHPNIIRLYETMKTSTLYCIVTECAEGGELLQFVKNECPNRCMAEPLARHFVRQLVSALFHMHENGIVHRDLKMENILLDKSKRNIKIIDFGLSNCHEPGEFLATHCGSPEYAAPELFVPGQVYGQEVDVWSLGVNMFAMLAGKLPFRVPKQGANRRKRLLDQISSGIGQQQEDESSHFSPSAMDLVRCLLQPDPSQRCTLRQAMNHPWLTCDASQPLVPYKAPAENAAGRDRIVDLMCARLDVQRSSVISSVRDNKCDWMAAIYHLLSDQPETQSVLRDLNKPEPVTSSRVASTTPPASKGPVSESESTPPSITAVMKKLEAAAGKPLTQTKGVQRHQSLGAADRRPSHESTKDKAMEEVQQTAKASAKQESNQPPTRSGFRNRFSLTRRSNRQRASTAPSTPVQKLPDTPIASVATVNGGFGHSPIQDESTDPIVGSPIRSAIDGRSMMSRAAKSLSSGSLATGHHPRRLSAGSVEAHTLMGKERSDSEPASVAHSRQGSLDSMGAAQQPSTPKKRPASAGGRMRPEIKDGSPTNPRTAFAAIDSGSDESSTLKKKEKKRRNSLLGSLRGKDKLAKSASIDDIPQFKDADGSRKSAKAPSSLSRSFALKPTALSTDGSGTPIAHHKAHTLQPKSSDYTDYFGQVVPQYELSMPWIGPVFPGYAGMDDSGMSQRRPASRRNTSRNRGTTMSDALTGYTPAYLQSSPFHSGGDYGGGERRSYYDGPGGYSAGSMSHNSQYGVMPGMARAGPPRRASSGSIPIHSSSNHGNSGKTFGLLRRSLRRKSQVN